MKETVIISGIKGFLGRSLVNFLIDEYYIYGIGKIKETINNIDVFSCEDVDKITINPDFIILCHAAVASGYSTPTTEELFDVNVILTDKIIKKFPKAKIIYISSASIYDQNSLKINEYSSINPQSEYAISKFWGEKLVCNCENGLILRLSSLYGIGMKENTIIPNYINQALNNNVIEVWGKGERKQNYIFIDDACHYIKLAIQKFDSLKNKVLLSVDKKEFSNIELAQIIAQDTDSKINYVNDDFSKSLHYDNILTCSLLNWEPKTDFVDKIYNYIKWKKEQF